MSESREKIYNDLNEGMLIGPDHHKFQLRGSPVDCPLGQLWQADDVSTKTPINVSVIVLDPLFLQSKSFLANFKKQIIRSKPLAHNHIADIYGYFIHRGGLLFFAFEPIEGLVLNELLPGNSNKTLNLKQMQGLLSQLSSAIVNCTKQWHSALGGIDGNFVFVNKKGGVKLLPVSMREFFKDNRSMPASVFEYKSWCAPEVLGEQKIDGAADSYAIACITYRLLGGEAFLLNETETQRAKALLSRPENIEDEQWLCLEKALSTDKTQRFKTPLEFIKAFFPPEPPPQEAGTMANGDSDNTESSEDTLSLGAKSMKKVNIKLGKKSFSIPIPPYSIPILILLLGIAIGFILGVVSSANKINKANDAMKQWKEQALSQEEILKTQSKKLQDLESQAKDMKIKADALEKQLKNTSDSGPPALSAFRDELADGQYAPDMVVLGTGDYLMGDTTDIGDDNEKPVHKVTFSNKFAISRHEVTFEQYDFFAKKTNRKLPDDEGWGRGQQPVINVSWRDARAYVRWLAKETGLPYRLPTEAEWEYAARAGTQTAYWWGDKLAAGYAHCSDCNPEQQKQPLPVGSFKANPWGLFDLNGNVDEWVQDCYSKNYNGATKDGSAILSGNCQYRSMRGGSWFDISRLVRSASRYRHPSDSTRNSWGFRVALSITS